jgi:hypothetical protein
MSAFDIAGAILWTPLAVVSWFSFSQAVKLSMALQWTRLWHATLTSLAAAFCIARLFGAHL